MSPDDKDRNQPYTRDTCTLPEMIKLALLARRESPCAGCEQSRARCGGEPRADGQARP
jgi:hypothetical protein